MATTSNKNTNTTFSFIIMSSLLTFILLPITTSSSSSKLLSFIYGGCSQLKYSQDNTAYITNLNSLLTSLLNSATYSSYNHFSVVSSTTNDVVYALYQCRGDLSMHECSSCVLHSVHQLAASCPASCGASVQLEGCYVKFDNDSFIGKPDKSVVFKKCGAPVGGGDSMGKMAARDAVLGRLVGAPGPYRVGGSKDVQAMAQCVGDQSVGECEECVNEGVKQVKMVCGSSSYGDVYLGKCYVRYSVQGGRGYFNSYPGSVKTYISLMGKIKGRRLSSQSWSDKNRGVKTFALVIGLLAAIVIVIIFLTFICRTFAGSNK